MFVLLTVVIALVSYGLGSLSFAYIITKKLTGDDIRTKGSGNAGFTNAMRVLPKKWGVLVFILDILKGLVAVIIGKLLLDDIGGLTAMLFAILGHMFPFWMGFRGGKGISTGFGATIAFDWRMAVIMLLLFLIVLLITNHVSAGSIAGAFALAFSGMYYHWSLIYVIVFLFAASLVIYKHRGNIERMINGTESKVFKSRKWNPLERR